MDFTDSVQHARDRFDADDIDPDGGNTENVAQSAKSMIAEADRAVESCNEVLRDQLEKVGRKVPTEKTVALIYTAYCAISAAGSQAQFLAERQIKVHGSTKNECYPIFRAFTRTAHPWLRDRVCKYAQVAALAVHQQVASEAFPDWLKRHPIEKACREYRRIMRERTKSERNEHLQRVWQFLVDPRKEPERAPMVPATPITPGHVGLKLAVVDFTHDGSGNFRVLGIMPHDADAVMRMALTAANKEM
ncbi:hypothetical protein [Bradyrhizobium sp. 164]|uniref:hypothetical protein n=1 Tax=Bradyrhizobium sp. 164 TaxID=2782637 RepID=UPI001FFC14C3|nr:hypothetical protein [Bradyrhizobium sp. 164]MCK1597949.1 hypothetical protein [Bradyrhizobium sp. 164]